MTAEDFVTWLHDTSFMAGMNQQYYQLMIWWWSWWDSVIKIVVVVLSVASVIAGSLEMRRSRSASPPNAEEHPAGGRIRNMLRSIWRRCSRILAISPAWPLSLRISTWSAIAAVVLLVTPTSSQVSLYKSLYSNWTDLRVEVDSIANEYGLYQDRPEDEPIDECHLKKVQDVTRQIGQIEGREPAPWMFLVDKCYADEVERRSRDSGDGEQHASSPEDRAVL